MVDIAILLIAYLIGSIPFGYIITRLIRDVDIRHYGSGNIGATNVLRLLGWKLGLLVFLLDAAKGVAAVLLAGAISDQDALPFLAGLAVLLGHCFPIFLKFKGGKGAATGIGVIAALSVWAALIVLLLAAAVIAATRYVSLGSILGAMSAPLIFWLLGYDAAHIYFGVVAALIIVLRHHANIARLLKGTEAKIGQRSGPAGGGSE